MKSPLLLILIIAAAAACTKPNNSIPAAKQTPTLGDKIAGTYKGNFTKISIVNTSGSVQSDTSIFYDSMSITPESYNQVRFAFTPRIGFVGQVKSYTDSNYYYMDSYASHLYSYVKLYTHPDTNSVDLYSDYYDGNGGSYVENIYLFNGKR